MLGGNLAVLNGPALVLQLRAVRAQWNLRCASRRRIPMSQAVLRGLRPARPLGQGVGIRPPLCGRW